MNKTFDGKDFGSTPLKPKTPLGKATNRLHAHEGCQIEDTQHKQAQLTVEGDKPYTVNWTESWDTNRAQMAPFPLDQ
ncbi:hypothetical protein Q8A67_015371 [Cirrhinus molitorella]|uniref:Uncharacterized protein n=1 Tax=Cirrhinus molitorella TaxID=172907 RepID=A0AA88PLN0_9TELE|nr:hypothetical protein Q8A67_015371 [Cirrhinus molitorella]